MAYGRRDDFGAIAFDPVENVMAKATKGQKAIVQRAMHAFKHGELRSGGGGMVTDPKQAIAIALSEADEAKPGHGGPAARKRKAKEHAAPTRP